MPQNVEQSQTSRNKTLSKCTRRCAMRQGERRVVRTKEMMVIELCGGHALGRVSYEK